MISVRQAKLLGLLRRNTFQGRGEFYRTALKDIEFAERGEMLIYNDLRVLELKKHVVCERVGSGKRARMVSIRLTELGLFEIASAELRGIVKDARIVFSGRDEIKAGEGKREKEDERAKAEPCGVVRRVCY